MRLILHQLLLLLLDFMLLLLLNLLLLLYLHLLLLYCLLLLLDELRNLRVHAGLRLSLGGMSNRLWLWLPALHTM